MPEPIPIRITRSPGCSESASSDSVIGIDAGPMLPRNGKVSGTLEVSIPRRSHIIDVCTCDCGGEHHRDPKGKLEDRIEALTEYKRALEKRIVEVEERIAELRKKR